MDSLFPEQQEALQRQQQMIEIMREQKEYQMRLAKEAQEKMQREQEQIAQKNAIQQQKLMQNRRGVQGQEPQEQGGADPMSAASAYQQYNQMAAAKAAPTTAPTAAPAAAPASGAAPVTTGTPAWTAGGAATGGAATGAAGGASTLAPITVAPTALAGGGTSAGVGAASAGAGGASTGAAGAGASGAAAFAGPAAIAAAIYLWEKKQRKDGNRPGNKKDRLKDMIDGKNFERDGKTLLGKPGAWAGKAVSPRGQIKQLKKLKFW
jgi:hypothetical protein